DVATRAIVARWSNGCSGSRGIDVDERGAFVFAGCAEGKAVVLDAQSGRIVSEAKTGAGVDIIPYASGPPHLYVPGASSATLAILSVLPTGELKTMRTVGTASGAHCGSADSAGHVLVCDPSHGVLLAVDDSAR